MGTQLLLLRHGESTWNAEGRIQGQADPPLSELGRRQASALGRRLSNLTLETVYTSAAERGRETSSAIAAPHAVTPAIEPALLELHLGSWQGRRMSDFTEEEALLYRAWERDPTSVTPPGGETITSALNRIAPVLDDILETHAGTSIVLVTHSIIGRVALSYLLGFGVELVPRLRLKKASVTKLRVQNGMTVMEQLSDTAHLRSLL
jgi:broad specificity phosphatase PhoE